MSDDLVTRELQRVAIRLRSACAEHFDAPALHEADWVEIARAAIASIRKDDELRDALEAADKRLCELTPNCEPDGPSTLAEADEVEKTRVVVMQIRSALSSVAGGGG